MVGVRYLPYLIYSPTSLHVRIYYVDCNADIQVFPLRLQISRSGGRCRSLHFLDDF